MIGHIGKAMAVISILSMLMGCSGHIYTIVDPKPEQNVYDKKTGYEGVLFYLPNHFYEISWTTAVIENGKVTKTASGEGDKKCTPTMQRKEVVRADFNEKYQLVYAPGLLEKYSWKVEFDQGVLKSINAESTPDRGETLKNLASAAGEVKPQGLGVLEKMPCTDLPELKYLVKVSDVCKKDMPCNLDKYAPKQLADR